MTPLRELAERWKHKAKGYPPNGDTAFSLNRCATELLSILNAEGDGGVVGAFGEIAGLIRECEQNAGKVSDFYAWEMIGRMSEILESTQFHPQPARSGVVSDEQVRDAAVAYSKRATDGSQDVNFHDCIRAALEHFAKSQGESNV